MAAGPGCRRGGRQDVPGGRLAAVEAAEHQRERLRAAIDRLHAAQLAALAAPAPAPLGGRAGDVFAAERQLLAQAAEIGMLLVELRRRGGDAAAVSIRLRLVALAVAGATTLAELVGPAFEVEGTARRRPDLL